MGPTCRRNLAVPLECHGGNVGDDQVGVGGRPGPRHRFHNRPVGKAPQFRFGAPKVAAQPTNTGGERSCPDNPAYKLSASFIAHRKPAAAGESDGGPMSSRRP